MFPPIAPKWGRIVEGKLQVIRVKAVENLIQNLAVDLFIADMNWGKMLWQKLSVVSTPPMLMLKPDAQTVVPVGGESKLVPHADQITLRKNETETLVVWNAWKMEDGSYQLAPNSDLYSGISSKDWKVEDVKFVLEFFAASEMTGATRLEVKVNLKSWDSLGIPKSN